jgi:hypothetical protein
LTLDWRAVALGAAVGFLIALPGLVLGGITDVAAFVILVFGGMASAGFIAASKRPDAPLTHGIIAALVTYATAALLAIALRLARGDDLHPAVYVFQAGVAAGFGLLGGYIADRRSADG